MNWAILLLVATTTMTTLVIGDGLDPVPVALNVTNPVVQAKLMELITKPQPGHQTAFDQLLEKLNLGPIYKPKKFISVLAAATLYDANLTLEYTYVRPTIVPFTVELIFLDEPWRNVTTVQGARKIYFG